MSQSIQTPSSQHHNPTIQTLVVGSGRLQTRVHIPLQEFYLGAVAESETGLGEGQPSLLRIRMCRTMATTLSSLMPQVTFRTSRALVRTLWSRQKNSPVL